MIKIATFLALLGVAVAGPVGFNQLGYGATYAAAPGYGAVAHPGYAAYAAPTAYRTVAAPAVAHYAAAPTVVRAVAPEPYDHHPQYNYGYSVSDGYTGDQKSHSESRDGDVVSGQYSLVEPDGALRTVTYTADPVNGFNAVVDRQAPAVVKAAVAPAPIVRAALPVAPAPVALGYGQYGAYNQAAYLSPYAGHNAHGLQYIQ